MVEYITIDLGIVPDINIKETYKHIKEKVLSFRKERKTNKNVVFEFLKEDIIENVKEEEDAVYVEKIEIEPKFETVKSRLAEEDNIEDLIDITPEHMEDEYYQNGYIIQSDFIRDAYKPVSVLYGYGNDIKLPSNLVGHYTISEQFYRRRDMFSIKRFHQRLFSILPAIENLDKEKNEKHLFKLTSYRKDETFELSTVRFTGDRYKLDNKYTIIWTPMKITLVVGKNAKMEKVVEGVR